jgi:protein-tyrosine-phosphatase
VKANVKRRVLVIDADSAAGLETVQSLGKKGHIIHAMNLHSEQKRGRSRFIARQFPSAGTPEAGVEQIIGACSQEAYDLIIPATEVALLALLSPQIPDTIYQRAVLPLRDRVLAALDKEYVWRLAKSLSIRVPASKIVTSKDYVPHGFPVVLKPVFSKKTTDREIRGYQVTIARDLTSWRSALESYSGIPVQEQEYVSGKGVGVEMLFEHGVLRWAFVHERVHELPITGGGSSYRVSIAMREDLIGSAVALLRSLNWHGAAMVEFKVAADGRVYLMEINPRLWGSLALAIDCGVDFPSGLLCLATGEKLPPQPQYRTGYFTRNVARDIEWLKTNMKADRSDPLLLTAAPSRSLFEWLRPLVGKESWDFFALDDPRVTYGELKRVFSENIQRTVRKIQELCLRNYIRYVHHPLVMHHIRSTKIADLLVLCFGNICRSPLAAAFATEALGDRPVQVSSGGFYPGSDRPCPQFVCSAAESLGIDLTKHRSRCVNAEMMERADLVVAMDLRNYRLIKQRFPRFLRKTVLLGLYQPDPEIEIRDPYDSPESMPAVSKAMRTAIERLVSIFPVQSGMNS